MLEINQGFQLLKIGHLAKKSEIWLRLKIHLGTYLEAFIK